MDRKIICLTPVKNEAWILRSFLTVVSTWADHIIISDNDSTDGSKEIAKSFPKVIFLENDEMKEFDEYQMRKPLIDAARKIPGDRVLVSLDADEAIPNINDEEWQKIINLPKGTLVQMMSMNVLPGFKSYFKGNFTDVIYIDDESDFKKIGLVHISRLSVSPQSVIQSSKGCFHFQFLDWNRMESKHRWYQCYERITFPNKNPLDIYRRYHWMYNPCLKIHSIPDEWKEDYICRGGQIEFPMKGVYSWDQKIYRYFDQYGPRYFQFIDIWDYLWDVNVTRSVFSKIFIAYLRKTTKLYNNGSSLVRFLDKFVKRIY